MNNCMDIMRTTQLGLPRPVGIHKGYYMAIIDLNDCFFTIPLHSSDSDKFSFSVLSMKYKEPYQSN